MLLGLSFFLGCNLSNAIVKMSIVSFLLAIVANNFAHVILSTLLEIFCLIIFNLMKLVFKICLFLLGAPSSRTSSAKSSSLRRFSHKNNFGGFSRLKVLILY